MILKTNLKDAPLLPPVHQVIPHKVYPLLLLAVAVQGLFPQTGLGDKFYRRELPNRIRRCMLQRTFIKIKMEKRHSNSSYLIRIRLLA